MRNIHLLTLFALFVLIGCSPRYDFKRHHIVRDSYKKDIIFLSNYVLCVGLTNYHNNYSFRKGVHHSNAEFGIQFNVDSIFNHFKSALLNTKLNFEISKKTYPFCDSSFYSNNRMRIENLNIDKVKNIAKGSGLKLVPIIYLDSHYQKHFIVGSSGVVSGGHFVKQTVLRVLICIIDNDEIIYLRSVQSFSDTYDSYDKKEKRTNIEQKHWDNLVELAMRDYIKRMK